FLSVNGMKVLIISDLHYDNRIFRGVDESKAWSWLLSIVNYHNPDMLLSCGDWGSAINPTEFYELLKKTIVLSIYGNHENMEVLTKLYNIKSDKYLPVLMEDGRIYEFCSLKIAGISGIISTKRKSRKGVPRKRPDEFIEVSSIGLNLVLTISILIVRRRAGIIS
ncbi:MAG: metallophosphoesterase family protein, partial [Candidatus Asgardarchaeia archaeon]